MKGQCCSPSRAPLKMIVYATVIYLCSRTLWPVHFYVQKIAGITAWYPLCHQTDLRPELATYPIPLLRRTRDDIKQARCASYPLRG